MKRKYFEPRHTYVNTLFHLSRKVMMAVTLHTHTPHQGRSTSSSTHMCHLKMVKKLILIMQLPTLSPFFCCLTQNLNFWLNAGGKERSLFVYSVGKALLLNTSTSTGLQQSCSVNVKVIEFLLQMH